MLDKLERFFINIATLAVLVMALLIFADVIALNVFNTSIPDVVIMVRELMVLAVIMPLAAVTTKRSHIAVEFVTNLLPARLVGWLVVFGTVFCVISLTPLIYSANKDLLHQLTANTEFYGDLGLPQWPGRLAFLTGITLCWLRLLVMAVNDFRTMLSNGSIKLLHD